jgi:hypothetical protein
MGDAPIIDGDGYYIIANSSNLYWMMVSMTNVTTPTFTNNFKLTANIDMGVASGSYTPTANTLQSICSTTAVGEGPFTGIFDGQKGAASPYTIIIPLSLITTNSYFGLFGFLGSGAPTVASVINLNVVYTGGSFSYTPSPLPATVSYLGSLVGYCNSATVNNCNVTYNNNVTITHSLGTNTTLQQYTGGICGKIDNLSVLTNSEITFLGTAKLLNGALNTINGAIFPIRAVGGICGYMGTISTALPIVLNTLQRCKLKISNDTLLGTDTEIGLTSNTQLVNKIGGICGAAVGDIILDNCFVEESVNATGGTLTIQNSKGDKTVASAECNTAVLIGELLLESAYSSNRQIKLCGFTLPKFDISFRISYGEGGGSPSNTACFIGKISNGTIQTSIPINYINNINGIAKNISIFNKTNNGSGFIFHIGGMFGIIGVAAIMCNIDTCNLTTLQNYSVTFSVATTLVGGFQATPLNYGGITPAVTIGNVPSSILDPNTNDYRKITNCSLNIGGNTTITITQTPITITGATGQSAIGGLFGLCSAGSRNNVVYPLIIDNCDATYSGNFNLLYTNIIATLTSTGVNNLFLGGFIGNSLGCNISNCDNTFGVSTANIMKISADLKVGYNCYMSAYIAQITNRASGSGQAPSTVTGCTIKVNGNVELLNNNIPTSTNTVRQSWNGGLIGRIFNGSECSNSSLEIKGTYTSTATSIGNLTSTAFLPDAVLMGGLVGEISGSGSPPNILTSKLLSCIGTVSGNTIFNANENVNFQAQIGGIVGKVTSYLTMDNIKMTYKGTSTLKSVAAGPGSRLIGGIIGLSSGTVNALKTIINSDVTFDGIVTIEASASSSLPSVPNPPNFPANAADGIIGGLFGRLLDGTAVNNCNGIFNSQLNMTNSGTLSGTNTSLKHMGGLCGHVNNSDTTGTALAATIINSSISVKSTTNLLSNASVITSNTRCGVLFGIVQDGTINYGTNASSCTGTFLDKVTLRVNNTNIAVPPAQNGIYMGGIVGYNVRSIMDSNKLILNGLEMDNLSITNTFCAAGLIAGRSESPISGNAARIIDSIVNITGTALLDTNSTIGTSAVGALGGFIDSQFKNNIINGENCIFTLNSSSTEDATLSGGLIGLLTNSQTTQSVDVSNNILKAKSLNLTTSSPIAGSESSYIAGVIGRINTSNITVNNNQVLVYDTTSLINSNANQTNNMALVFAGIEGTGPNTVTNNIFLTVKEIIIRGSNSPQPTVIRINSVTASNTSTNTRPTNNFAYICSINPVTLLDFQSYPTNDANGLTIFGVNYPITSQFIDSYNLYYINILPAITIQIGCIIPIPPTPITCCTANICNKNPQSANYSNEVIVNRRGGQAMIADVDNQNANKITNTGRIYVKPIFSSYQQYMTYLQSKNAR